MSECSFQKDKSPGDPEKSLSLTATGNRASKKALWTSLKLLCCFAAVDAPLYTPLAHADSMRLLRLHSGKRGRPIKCTLETVLRNEDAPPYEALSYVWLLKEGTRTISCNDHQQEVPLNLWEALDRLRHRTMSRLLWVDKLCIDQESTAEKDELMPRMNHVYRDASRVLVWFGTDDENQAHQAYSHICTLVNAQKRTGKPASFSTQRKYHKHTIQCTHAPPSDRSEEWSPLFDFFRNKWWSRMWVLQEIVLARQATFIWGQAEISWDYIVPVIDIIRSNPYLIIYFECREFQNAWIMQRLHFVHRPAPPSKSSSKCLSLPGSNPSATKTTPPNPHIHPLLHLLDLARSFDVTYPKDKVYSLLGFPDTDLTSPSSPYSVYKPPPYSCSVKETYTHTARTIITSDKNLDILSFTSHVCPLSPLPPTTLDPESLDSLPSWVPNWCTQHILYPLTAWSSAPEPSEPAVVHPHPDPYTLSISGYIIDEISSTILHPTEFDPRRSSRPAFHRLLTFLSSLPSPPTLPQIAQLLIPVPLLSPSSTDKQIQHLANLTAFLLNLDPKRELYKKLWPQDEREAESLSTAARERGVLTEGREAVWRFGCYRGVFLDEAGKGDEEKKWGFVGEAWLGGWRGEEGGAGERKDSAAGKDGEEAENEKDEKGVEGGEFGKEQVFNLI
ncbi:HET-domain-containing protein [Sporormia fimetaria CBS 119925]|uniref:HET-domain-containing protein n=1 Tax=Sporormia fimetaria CBS 119925 TaxID=1340428 RepID=A0A6A6UW63_9PLEO|nr:HET-domain-containing protein [Sporormia fimetaria CBS 119925]